MSTKVWLRKKMNSEVKVRRIVPEESEGELDPREWVWTKRDVEKSNGQKT